MSKSSFHFGRKMNRDREYQHLYITELLEENEAKTDSDWQMKCIMPVETFLRTKMNYSLHFDIVFIMTM